MAAVRILETAKGLVGFGECELRDKLFRVDTNEIKELGDNINGVVDFAESGIVKGGRIVVQMGVSDQLDGCKRRHAALEPMLVSSLAHPEYHQLELTE